VRRLAGGCSGETLSCRLLVAPHEHYDHPGQMPPPALASFTAHVQRAARALRGLDDVTRLNVAVLGNSTTQVYAHVIPRCSTEPNFSPRALGQRRAAQNP
jgi:diadenosine tetraphosphate (Ap4A) HIT family hydrolase